MRLKIGVWGSAIIAAAVVVSQTGCPMPDSPDDGIRLARELVADGFASPTFVTSFPDDASRLLVLEQYTGRVLLLQDGAKQDTPFLDIDDKVADDGAERGLFSLAFHPDFADNGLFYVCYSNNGGATVVEEYVVSENDPNAADPDSGVVILTVPQPRTNHNGGMIAFSPRDSMLYVGLGDGGGANDPDDNAQNLETVLGKILRLDLSAPDLVPEDNPFVNDEENPDADPLIWAYGLRNPWRFSFDQRNGRLYIGDVGQNAREEINVQSPESEGGENYGWRVAEGFACRGGLGECGTMEGFTPPVIDYNHTIGRSVTGGYVYRGDAIPELRGHCFFGDFITSRVWTFRLDAGRAVDLIQRTESLGPFAGVSSFGQDADGEVYIVDYGNGAVYKVVPTPDDEEDA